MDETEFAKTLRAQGYDVLTRDVEPELALDEHDHAWDVKGLVLSGAFNITAEGRSRTYETGQSFELAAGVPHTVSAGSQGARLLLGRRNRVE
ncbi:cupin [Ruegeria sediminis]|uniref:Cupin n=1 Tax=Ruegeria sediminis TaxID=2583820 RepID=A0ABY2WUD5_9RHOB|nr:cupin domain-containing protein [Ruegeria sediminis]TMV04218.1 cupin [Ruegeria sediminis]